MQTGFVFATDRIGFDFSHISPGGGVKRLFSLRAILELLKSVAKVALVGAVAWLMLRGEIDRLSLLSTLSPEDILGEIARLVLRLLFRHCRHVLNRRWRAPIMCFSVFSICAHCA